MADVSTEWPEKRGTGLSGRYNGAGLRNRNGKKWGRRVVLYMLRNPVYVGKIRWREVLHDGVHTPIVSDVLFDKAKTVLEERKEELKGRQWHNVDQRLLTGVLKCGRCNSHMFGAGGRKNGVQIPYYVCSKRLNDHDCDQDYVRAERIEGVITQDIEVMLRDEEFLAKVWEEANRKLGAQKPDLDREVEKVEADLTKTRATITRYFDAFEAGTLDAALCGEKVGDLKARLDELEATRQDLVARQGRMELPAIDREMIAALIDNFGKVMAEAPGPQRKDLLHRLVKKVLIHDRHTVEVWYRLPNRQGFEHWHTWLPG